MRGIAGVDSIGASIRPITRVGRPSGRALPAGRTEAWKQRLASLALVSSDTVLALLVWEVASVLQGAWGQGPLSGLAVATIVPSVAAWVGLRGLLGLYPGYGLDQTEELRKQTHAVLATLAVTTVFAVAFQVGDSLSRLLLALGFLGLTVLAPLTRHFAKWSLMKVGVWGKPVIILSSGEIGEHLPTALRREWALGLRPVAISEIPAPSAGELEDATRKKVLADAAAVAKSCKIDTIILNISCGCSDQLAALSDWASTSFRHVVVLHADLAGVMNSSVVARGFAGTFAMEIKYNLLDPWALRLKRVLDLTAAAIGSLLIVPLVLLLALFVYAEAPHAPIFYRAKRMGRDGRLFSCVKFRTMVPDAEVLLSRVLDEDPALRDEYLEYHKLHNDPRVTRVGCFLRKTSLDELPQLWNVLKGEMSLVGPRPYLPRESEEVGATQRAILRVPPGITGPWQVAGRNKTPFGERVKMDAYYVRDWSIWLDLVILARTVGTVLLGRGAQ